MTARSRMKIDDLIVNDGTILDNVLADPEILTLLADVGYDQAALEAGKALQEQAMTLHLKQKKEYGDQVGATQALNEAWESAKVTYKRHWNTAKIVFASDEQAKRALDLTGTRKVSLAGWLVQAYAFYTNALENPSYRAELAKRGIATEKLNEGLALVRAVDAANTTQESEKVEAQDATKARNDALDHLNEWMTEFLGFAKIALEDRPLLVKKLGLTTE